jgi:fatty-acyl-CoA synthase
VATAADLSLGGWLARRAARTPDRTAITFDGQARTYGALQSRIDNLALGLRDGGVRPGDRIGYLSQNHPSYFEALFATARLGAVFVPLNPRLTGAELSFQIRDAGLHTLICAAGQQPIIDGIFDDLPLRRRMSTGAEAGTWEAYPDLDLDGPPAEPFIPGPVEDDDTAVIMYTSGSTGVPKGAMLSHANLFWCNVNNHLGCDYIADEVTLCVLPLFHIGGLNSSALTTFQKGGEILLHAAFDPSAVLEALTTKRVTTMVGVPAMFQAITMLPEFETADLSALRFLVAGGAPVPESLVRLFLARDVLFQQGYGLTECSPQVLYMDPGAALTKPGAAGRPGFFTDVRLVDPSGADVTGPDARGELLVRGPHVMTGYWNRPEATAAALDGQGWLRTGDIAQVDEQGYYRIVDRAKDLVISGGENVYPTEVENVLYGHGSVAEVAVIGAPDEKWGETVVAVVVPREGCSITLDEVREFAGASLARFKLPTRLHIVDVLPRTASGKVLKYRLRESFDSAHRSPSPRDDGR